MESKSKPQKFITSYFEPELLYYQVVNLDEEISCDPIPRYFVEMEEGRMCYYITRVHVSSP